MTNRKLNIEFIRIFAMVMTICIHVSNNYLRAFDEISQGDFFVSVIFNSLSRVCVPLFFMISGAFAIGKEYNRKTYFEKILKFVLILAVWNLIYFITRNGFNLGKMGKAAAACFFNAEMTSRHLWYMYALIGLYIALPFIQNMCKNMSRELENLFLILWFCLSGLTLIFLPLASFITKTKVAITYPIPLINSAYYLGYFIGGHILYKRFKDIKFDNRKNLICVAAYLGAMLITIIATYFISLKRGYAIEQTGWYRGALIIIASFAIFTLFVTKGDSFKANAISVFSKQTFGIYLIHIIFLDIIKHFFHLPDFNPLIAIPLLTAAIYVCSWGSCFVISKIPILKNLIQ